MTEGFVSKRNDMRQELNTWRLIALFLALTVVALAIGLGTIYTTRKDYNEVKDQLAISRGVCSSDGLNAESTDFSVPGPSVYNETHPHPLEDLYPSELESIVQFLATNATLNLSLAPENLTENYIYGIELFPPPKDQVVDWLEDSTNHNKPNRYALVLVILGASSQVQELKVGPLPITPSSTIVVNRYIPWKYRPVSALEFAKIDDLIVEFLNDPDIARVFQEVYNITDVNEEVDWTGTSPRGEDGSSRLSWNFFMHYIEGSYITSLGLEIQIDHTSKYPEFWEINKIAFNNIPYENITTFMDAYNLMTEADKHKFPLPTDGYSTLEQRGDAFPGEDIAPPRHYNPQGIRFSVAGKEVSWLGWKFLVTSSYKTGVSFKDIRFGGERIVYELTQQNAAATYSGRQAAQASSQYDDSGWGMGVSAYSLIRGADCPETSVFLDLFAVVDSSEVSAFYGSICVFEQDLAAPAMRHYGKNANFDGVGAATSIAASRLVVRTAVTVYNYDYIMTHSFHLDGTIEVTMEATGYMQSGRWFDATDNTYGTRVHEHVMGSLHDHILGYKVDMDVLGTQNTFQTLSVAYAAADNNPFLPSSKTMKAITYTNVPDEDSSTFRVNPDHPKYFNFINTDATANKWGVPRGYRIEINSKANSLQPFDTIEYGSAFSWMKYNLAVTQRKETEQHSSEHMLDMNVVSNPLTSFDTFLDGESLLQEDLVAWVSFGGLHIPHSEDVPVTTTAASAMGFSIKPFNFFDETPLVRLSKRITVQEDATSDSGVSVNDQITASECYQAAPEFRFAPNYVFGG